MTRHPDRCIRNLATRDEDSGRYGAYVPCGKPAHWYVAPEEWPACEEHALEALRDGFDEVYGALDGEPMVLDGDGEIARSA